MGYNDLQVDLIDERIGSALRREREVGTITSRNSLSYTDIRCTVTIDGATVAVPAKTLGGCYAFEGDRVVLERYGSDWVVVDTFSRRLMPSESGVEQAGGGITTASATFSAISGASFPWTKYWSDTRVKTTAHIGSWASGATDSYAQFGVDFDGTFQQEICGTAHNTASEHRIASGLRWRSGLAAGTYTVSVLWKRLSGTATLQHDSNDNLSVMVTEVV